MLALIVAAQVGYHLYVGGDTWDTWNWDAVTRANRYLTSVVPVLIILAAVGVSAMATSLREGEARARTWLTAFALVSVGVFLGLFVLSRRVSPFPPEPVRLAALTAFAMIALRVALSRRLSKWPPWGIAAVMTLALLLTMSGASMLQWTNRTAPQLDDLEQGWTGVGLALKEVAPPGTTTAIAGAGAIAYFSHQPSIDLLGKMDRTIANMRALPDAPDVPGHNKWDYRYSVCQLRPDIVVQLFNGTQQDYDTIHDCGYTLLGDPDQNPLEGSYGLQSLWVRDDLSTVDHDRLCATIARLALDGASPCHA